MSYLYITNPLTNQSHNLFSEKGLFTLQNYLEGGASIDQNLTEPLFPHPDPQSILSGLVDDSDERLRQESEMRAARREKAKQLAEKYKKSLRREAIHKRRRAAVEAISDDDDDVQVVGIVTAAQREAEARRNEIDLEEAEAEQELLPLPSAEADGPMAFGLEDLGPIIDEYINRPRPQPVPQPAPQPVPQLVPQPAPQSVPQPVPQPALQPSSNQSTLHRKLRLEAEKLRSMITRPLMLESEPQQLGPTTPRTTQSENILEQIAKARKEVAQLGSEEASHRAAIKSSAMRKFDEIFQFHLAKQRELHLAKERAIRDEDYDEAKRINLLLRQNEVELPSESKFLFFDDEAY